MAEYIECEQVMQAIGTVRNIYSEAKNFTAVSAIDNVIGEIDDKVPAADVAPVVHGHIIRKHRNRGGFELLKGVDVKTGETRMFRYDGRYGSYDPYCSVCGKLMGEALNYCSNCGAKMDGEESNG